MAREMKDSGIEWIGEIPANWEIIRLKYIVEFEPKCDFSTLGTESVITYAPMENIKNGYYIPKSATYGSLSTSLTPFEENDIVLAKVTPCFENGNTLYICGNGGSCADAAHIVGELMKGFIRKRPLAQEEQDELRKMDAVDGAYLAEHLQCGLSPLRTKTAASRC